MDNSEEITVKDLVFQNRGMNYKHPCALCYLDNQTCYKYLTAEGARLNKLCVENNGYYDINKKKKYELNGGIPER